MAIKVGVVETEFAKAQSQFSEARERDLECVPVPVDELTLANTVKEQAISHVIIGTAAYTGPLYQALEPGGVIARFGVGHDGVDKLRATGRGLICTNTPGVLDDSVAEHAINLLLVLARRTLAHVARVRAGEWSAQLGIELKGKRLAVLGCGPIGCRVAGIAALGLGMRVTGFARSSKPGLQQQFGFERVVTAFQEAVQEADFVSLHLPATPETRHFLGPSRIEGLAQGCFLINTARGTLIDESALFDAVVCGKLSGVALDVTEREPYVPIDPHRDLRKLANVIITPHIASSTREACARIAARALRNIELATRARYSEMDVLNPGVLTRIRPIG